MGGGGKGLLAGEAGSEPRSSPKSVSAAHPPLLGFKVTFSGRALGCSGDPNPVCLCLVYLVKTVLFCKCWSLLRTCALLHCCQP